MKKPQITIDYNVLVSAISSAALSRRTALQLELAVTLIHFTQEKEGTSTAGKSNLKSVYQGAGYLCMTKADPDYRNVNRRINGMAAAFDKLGSSLVNSWIEGHGDTQSILDYIITELVPYGFDTFDDVLDFGGKMASNRTKTGARQSSGPVAVTTPAPAPAPAPAAKPTKAELLAMLTSQYGAEELREFCTELLQHVAALEIAAEQQQAA